MVIRQVSQHQQDVNHKREIVCLEIVSSCWVVISVVLWLPPLPAPFLIPLQEGYVEVLRGAPPDDLPSKYLSYRQPVTRTRQAHKSGECYRSKRLNTSSMQVRPCCTHAHMLSPCPGMYGFSDAHSVFFQCCQCYPPALSAPLVYVLCWWGERGCHCGAGACSCLDILCACDRSWERVRMV